MKETTVSVIIPTYNLISCLSDCVESVRALSDCKIQLIVVDNAPDDEGTKAWCESFGDIEYYRNTVNNFPSAINLGMEHAVGDYIVWLNNDTIVCPHWDSRLIEAFAGGEAAYQIEVGAVGPISTTVGGPQREENLAYTADGYEKFTEEIYQARKGAYEMSGFLTGFCLMVKASAAKKVGKLDEDFGIDAHGGFEDNDYITRLIHSGYTAIIHRGVFIHHQMSRTFRKFFPEDKVGMVNKSRFYRKWKEINKQHNKLAVCYRVRIPNDRHMDYFERSLSKCASFADGIAIFNDHSTVDNFHDKVKAACGPCEVVIHDKEGDLFNERDDRNQNIDLAKSAFNPDWLITLDHDEIFEDAVTRQSLEKLMNFPDPVIKSYGFHFCTFHNDENKFRKDGTMGNMAGYRMWRNVPGRKIIRGNKIGLHCGNHPEFSNLERSFTNFRIKHLGYVDKVQDRERKKDYYNSLDTDKKVNLIGADNYDHVADESTLRLYTYKENNGAALVLMVKNEEDYISELLNRHGAMFPEIIVVDTGSTDHTVELCKYFTDKVYLFNKETRPQYFDEDGTLMDLSAPRNFGLDQVTEEWAVILDADEYIHNPLVVRHMMDENTIDAYQHQIKNLQRNGHYTISESIRTVRMSSKLRWTGRVHETIDKKTSPNSVVTIPHGLDHIHTGFLKSQEKVHAKLEHYSKLLRADLQDNANNAKAHYAIGAHFMNKDRWIECEAAFTIACNLEKTFYPPRRDLCYYYMRKGATLMQQTLEFLPQDHTFRPHAQKVLDFVRENCGVLKVGNPDLSDNTDVLEYHKIMNKMFADDNYKDIVKSTGLTDL